MLTRRRLLQIAAVAPTVALIPVLCAEHGVSIAPLPVGNDAMYVLLNDDVEHQIRAATLDEWHRLVRETHFNLFRDAV